MKKYIAILFCAVNTMALYAPAAAAEYIGKFETTGNDDITDIFYKNSQYEPTDCLFVLSKKSGKTHDYLDIADYTVSSQGIEFICDYAFEPSGRLEYCHSFEKAPENGEYHLLST